MWTKQSEKVPNLRFLRFSTFWFLLGLQTSKYEYETFFQFSTHSVGQPLVASFFANRFVVLFVLLLQGIFSLFPCLSLFWKSSKEIVTTPPLKGVEEKELQMPFFLAVNHLLWPIIGRKSLKSKKDKSGQMWVLTLKLNQCN